MNKTTTHISKMDIQKEIKQLKLIIKKQPQEKEVPGECLPKQAMKLIGDLTKKSHKLDDQSKSSLEQLEKIIKKMEENRNHGAHYLCKEAWDKLLTILEAFEVYAKDQEERFKTQEESFKTQNKRLEQVEKKLKDKEEKLALGQVVWEFEQAVAKYVLPKGTKITKFGAYNQMTNWLFKDNKKDKIVGRQKWYKLQETVNWNNKEHPHLLESLKNTRNDVAHPKNIDLEEAKTQAKDYLSDDQYQCFLGIVRIIEETKETSCDSGSVELRKRKEASLACSTSKKRKI